MSFAYNAALCVGSLMVSIVSGAWSYTDEGSDIRVRTAKYFLAALSLITGMVFTFLLALLIHGAEILAINSTQAMLLVLAGFIPGWTGLFIFLYFRHRAASKKEASESPSESKATTGIEG
jgi:cytochrome c biogenesis protein CcdA